MENNPFFYLIAAYICIGKVDGNYEDPNAVACNTHYACANQNGAIVTCPTGAKYFNIALRACQATPPPGQDCEGTGKWSLFLNITT